MMVTYDECAAAIEFVFDAHGVLMLVCLGVGVVIGYAFAPKERIVHISKK